MNFLSGLSILFVLLFSANSHAQFQARYYSQKMDETKEITILTEELNRLDGTFVTLGQMLFTWIGRSEKDNALCEQYSKEQQPQLRLMCVRHDLKLATDRAFEQKKIDEVESSNLHQLLSALTIKKGQLTFLPIKPALLTRLFQKKQRRVIIPTLSDYESKANFFRHRREQMGQPSDLDPEILSLLKKAYHRKIVKLGRVTPDQYILSKYSIAQINVMAGLILETTQWTDEKVTGEIVLDRVGLQKKKSRLTELQASFVKDSQAGMSPEVLKPKGDEIEALKKEIELADTQKKIEELNDQRYELAVQLAEVPKDDEHKTEIDDLNTQLMDLSDQIDELESQLESERITITLDAGDLHRMAMNHLENMIETKMREKGGVLYGFNGTYADLLVAAYLAGEVDAASLKALLQIKDFKEIHESILLKAGKFVWAAGRMYLMMNPYTVIPTTLVSVFVSAMQKKKEYEKTMAEKTYLIRQ